MRGGMKIRPFESLRSERAEFLAVLVGPDRRRFARLFETWECRFVNVLGTFHFTFFGVVTFDCHHKAGRGTT